MCESVFNNLGSVSKSLVEQDRSFWRRVLFLSALFALIGWCGFSILSFYATEIFTKSGSPISATHTSWITASTKIFCAILSFYVLHKFSRSVKIILTLDPNLENAPQEVLVCDHEHPDLPLVHLNVSVHAAGH